MKNNYLIILILSIRAMYFNSNIWGLSPDIRAQINAIIGIKKKGIPSIHSYDIIKNIENYEFLTLFPSGVSWTVSFFDLFFNDIFISLYVFCFLCILIFYFYLFKIVDLFKIKTLPKLIIYLFLFLSNGLLISGGVSDVLSITSFLIAFYYSLIYIKGNKIINLYILSFVLWISFFSRFAYYPLVFIFPAALFVYNFLIIKNREYKPIFISTLLLSIGIALQNLYIRFHSQHLTYFHIYEEKESQIYFENLLQQDYFFLQPFFPNLANVFKNLLIPTTLSIVLIWVISIFFICSIIFLAYKKYKLPTTDTLYKFVCWVALITISFNVGMLILLSLRYAPQSWLNNGVGWTYVQETRYYMPSIFLIFIVLVLLLEENKRVVFYFMCLSILYCGFIFSYYIYKFDMGYASVKENYISTKWTTKNLNSDVIFLSSTKQDYISGGGAKLTISAQDFFEKPYKLPATKKIIFLEKDIHSKVNLIDTTAFKIIKTETTPYFKAYWLESK